MLASDFLIYNNFVLLFLINLLGFCVVFVGEWKVCVCVCVFCGGIYISYNLPHFHIHCLLIEVSILDLGLS